MTDDLFGRHLRALRLARGLSLRAMAGRMGVAHPDIVRWEKQDHPPKYQTLERLAAARGCPVSELLPAGSNSGTAARTEPVSGRLPAGSEIPTVPEQQQAVAAPEALDERVAALSKRLEDVKRDRAELREMIVEVCAAQADGTDQSRLARAWNRLRGAAEGFELKEMQEAVGSIPDVQPNS
jgi:transcriptional regulator with XRE-family HTH domain